MGKSLVCLRKRRTCGDYTRKERAAGGEGREGGRVPQGFGVVIWLKLLPDGSCLMGVASVDLSGLGEMGH